jgi:putative transcriptional regulator
MRRERRLTQSALAEAIGVPQPTIARLESETHEPSLRVALLIAAELNTTVEALFETPDLEARRARAAAATPRSPTTQGGSSMPSSQQTEPHVLIKENPSSRYYGHKTHALDCPWASSGNTGSYIAVPASSVPTSWGRCRHCGGGR